MNKFGREGKATIVAEMAQSYEGSLDVAIEIATKVCRAGVDAVMFQVVYADELAVPANKNYGLFRSLELSADDWKRVVARVHETGGLAFGEIFGKRSTDVVLDVGIDGFKIHAADVNNLALLRQVGTTDLPILLSAGGSTEEEIGTAVEVLQESGNSEIILMHGYQLGPTPLEDTHILKMSALADVFGLPVGYSDHISGCVDSDISQMNPLALTVPLVALGAGAKVIEKHVILDRTRLWEDHESALTPDEFVSLVSLVRAFEASLGARSLVPNVAEGVYRKTAKKNIVAARELAAGTILEEGDITFKRIGKPDDGIMSASKIIGKTLCRSLRYDDVIKREDLNETRS